MYQQVTPAVTVARDVVLSRIASHLLDVSPYAGYVTSAKWDIKDVTTESSVADRIVKAFSELQRKLTSILVTNGGGPGGKAAKDAISKQCCLMVMEQLVEGFSKVKKVFLLLLLPPPPALTVYTHNSSILTDWLK